MNEIPFPLIWTKEDTNAICEEAAEDLNVFQKCRLRKAKTKQLWSALVTSRVPSFAG